MKFKNDANVNMTSLRGTVRTTFAELVMVFGKPDCGPFDYSLDKTTCEWHLEFEDGVIATIYDWKMGDTPMFEYDWHIGGRSAEAVDRVIQTLSKELSNV